MDKYDQPTDDLAERRLAHQFEVQTRQVEKLFAENETPAVVERGEASPTVSRFTLDMPFKAGVNLLKDVKDELMSALGVRDFRLSRIDGKLQLAVTHQQSAPVTLVDLLPYVPSQLPPSTAVLGIDGEQTPILLEFRSSQLSHALIAGDSGAGKSALLRTITTSLAMLNRQSQLQLLVIGLKNQPDKTDLTLLNYIPHLLEPVAITLEDASRLLAFLAEEVAYRQAQRLEMPLIGVLIDDVDQLMEEETAVEQLIYLLQNGPACGVHLCLTVDEAAFETLPPMISANIPLRLVGRASSLEFAKQMSGLVDSDADLLHGEGHFLSIIGEELGAFQVAFVDDYDLHLCVDTLYRHRPRPMLAKRAPSKPPIALKPDPKAPTRVAVTKILDEPNETPFVDVERSIPSPEEAMPIDTAVSVHNVTDQKPIINMVKSPTPLPELDEIPFELGSPPDSDKEDT